MEFLVSIPLFLSVNAVRFFGIHKKFCLCSASVTFIFRTLIIVSCLHFGQLREKFLKTVSFRIFSLVLHLQMGRKTHKYERQGKHSKSRYSQRHKFCIIPNEDSCQRQRRHFRHSNHANTENTNHN